MFCLCTPTLQVFQNSGNSSRFLDERVSGCAAVSPGACRESVPGTALRSWTPPWNELVLLVEDTGKGSFWCFQVGLYVTRNHS